ncbi:RNAse P Rpr2/Rpp21/SNM1 subunit domain-containing protein [Ampelomyces quisqualis]|uniref:RNAse P Rpr2/Rpp21/SNM1 subunit domain-containing protein n=1 Tax=Ampelomyces quisqualis TaxID=50730 RepID=A0A6A5QNY0_AMPQU|nr:RNAse P Rpr2/Rpp21/SNM1 subunit domain-containing protein [Ampelomyces quisqualis]
MSKVKPPKSKGIPSKHLHARTAFLYQAATYLTLQTSPNDTVQTPEHLDQTHSQCSVDCSPISLQLGSDLQQVSRKAQLRLSVELKRTICKRCNTVLIHGRTATQTIENASKGGKKPWADVLVLECKVCGGKKKFPVEPLTSTSTELDSNTC